MVPVHDLPRRHERPPAEGVRAELRAETEDSVAAITTVEGTPMKGRSLSGRCKPPHKPFIGPCRDPLCLWFLHWHDVAAGRCYVRYYADRAEARAALRAFRLAPV